MSFQLKERKECPYCGARRDIRGLHLGRTTAEELVKLLEACEPKAAGSWRHTLAADIRHEFGMITFEQQQTNQMSK